MGCRLCCKLYRKVVTSNTVLSFCFCSVDCPEGQNLNLRANVKPLIFTVMLNISGYMQQNVHVHLL